MDRNEHLAWAKQRALELLKAGDRSGAVASMTSDLSKHEAFRTPGHAMLAQMGLLKLIHGGDIAEWIRGFN